MRALAILTFVLGLGLAACGDDDSGVNPDSPLPNDAMVTPDAAPPDADQSDAACYMNPMTHFQIINACTTADQVPKDDSTLPLLNPDGTLPPLPP